MVSHLLREFILPPGCLLIAGAICLLLLKSRPRVGRYGSGLLLGSAYLLSIPLVSVPLTRSTQEVSARSLREVREFEPEVVVVLGGGVYRDAPEYGGAARVGTTTYVRLAYGAYLSKALDSLPILVTGGYGETLQESEGFVAAQELKEWGVEKVWMETESENTRQNAVLSKELLNERGVSRIALVTSASHAGRALDEFREVGLNVLVCPTGFRTSSSRERGVFVIVPTHHHFNESSYALRTHLARIWYKLRY